MKAQLCVSERFIYRTSQTCLVCLPPPATVSALSQ